jgi:hypothetical protein
MLGNFQVAPAPDAAVAGLRSLIAQRTAEHGIDPAGEGFFVNGVYPNLAGHRDYLATACPGDGLHALIPALRTETQPPPSPDYRAAWVQHAVPAVIARGRTVRRPVTVLNAGANAWTRTGPFPFRIGYRWYRANGEKYNAEPAIEIHTNLPADVPPGQRVTIGMLLRAPVVPGRYLLQVDMVHELVTWFEDAGSIPLWLDVSVV